MIILSNPLATHLRQMRSILVSEGGASLLLKTNRFLGNFIVDGYYDRPLVQCILSFSAHFPTFLDVGAHTGSITFSVSQAFRRCIMIEPSPEDASVLRERILSRELPNCQVFECALSDEPGRVSLGSSKANSGDKSLADRPDLPVRTIVKATTLDSLAQEAIIVAPCLIKLDVQGYEPLVCQGGRRVLEQECAVVSEFWPWGIRTAGASPTAYVAFMIDMGFTVRSIANRPIAPETLERFIRVGEHDRYVTTDVLFVRD
jgi:FkbM family methyltransferase